MASTTPGGNAWDPEGRPPDQATAQMRDALDRELAEGAMELMNWHLDRLATSHVSLDTDGTPFFDPGSITVAVLRDSDGTPFVMGR